MTSLKPKLIVCGTKEREMLDNMKCLSSFDTTVATATGKYNQALELCSRTAFEEVMPRRQ